MEGIRSRRTRLEWPQLPAVSAFEQCLPLAEFRLSRLVHFLNIATNALPGLSD